MNIIDLLLSQHEEVERLFNSYEDGDHSVGNTINQKLDLHTKIEESLVYPAIRSYVNGGDEMVDHAQEEHNEVKELLKEFSKDFDNEEVFEQIRDDVLHHVEEEEEEIFPALEDACSEEFLEEVGARAEAMFL